MRAALLPLVVATLAIAGPYPVAAQAPGDLSLSSPGATLTLSLSPGAELTYRLDWRGRPLVLASPISLTLGPGRVLGPDARVISARRRTVDGELRPVVPEKDAVVLDHFNELSVDFEGGWGLDLRAYDDGVAYRFRTETPGDVVVEAEGFTIRLPGDPGIWFPAEESFLTHSERHYREGAMSEIPDTAFASLPLLLAPEGLPKVLVTESDLRSYPGLYLRGTGGPALEGLLPAYPLREEQVRDRTVRVTERAGFLARTGGPRSFPWRVFLVAEEDGDLVESTLVWRLAPELRIQDPSWIRPGKVAWDWWNASGLHGVDFESGLNTATYLHFIDFAGDHGIEYVILDEGWSDPADLKELNPNMNLPLLLDHARARGVGLILWVVWKSLDDELEEALERFAAWGVAGVKVDFMQRDDQPMVEYYWNVAEAAARHHLLVDFHGSYKPAGLRRAYPNVLTREGVLGLEQSKWSPHPTPKHNVTLPYIRMVAGPMDYTPGAMRNAQEQQFHPVFDRPMSLGTRVHQLAMYVVFESPLQMLADSPSNYEEEPECLAFLSSVPTTWDETRVLSGQVGEWIALARRKGEDWYVGVMTNWSPRELVLDLSFLGEGDWRAEIFSDGVNARRNAEDFRQGEEVLNPAEHQVIRLAPGGGWVARLRPGG
jgi:alpha-glucosidase